MNNRRLYSLKVKRVVFKQALGIRTCELSNTWKLSPRSSLRTCHLLYCIASASTVPARSYSNGPLELMILVSSIHTDICTEVIQNSPSPYLRVRVRTQATVSFPLSRLSLGGILTYEVDPCLSQHRSSDVGFVHTLPVGSSSVHPTVH